MKCAACGYEKLGHGNKVIPEEVVVYKSGAKKGLVKNVIPERISYCDLDPDKAAFIDIFLSNNIEVRRLVPEERAWYLKDV